MKLKSLEVYRCPVSHQKLNLGHDCEMSGDDVIEGCLFTVSGNKYVIKNGIPIFLSADDVKGKAVDALTYYTENASMYEEYLPIAFDLFFSNEEEVRQYLVDQLKLESDSKVLDLTAGTGRDSTNIIKALKNGELWINDIAESMLNIAKNKLSSTSCFKQYSVASACSLPYKDGYFDRLFSFTGLGSFPDVEKAMKEIARVVRVGGRVVICEKSVPPWLRNSDFGKILIEANPMFADEMPLKYISENAKNVEVKWIMQNCFYVISFEVGDSPPKGNFALQLPGPRGGSFFTRYYGKLEGVSLETKELVKKAAKSKNQSLHSWLDENLRNIATADLK